MKRIGNHVGRNAHEAVNEIVINSSTNDMLADSQYLLCKQILADLPVTPTNDCIHSLLAAIQEGLLGDDISVYKRDKESWKDCLDRAMSYLISINRVSKF